MPCLNFSLRTDTLAALRQATERARRNPARSARAALGAGALVWALTALANPTSPAAAEPDLFVRARAWLAAVHQVNPSEILVQPLDPRLQINNCAAGWAFDKPFPQNEGVVRARCQDTQWQLFLSVSLPRANQTGRPAPLAPGLPNAAARSAAPPSNSQAAPFPAAAPVAATVPVAYPTSAWMPGASPAPAAPVIPLAVRRGNTVLTVWSPAPGLAVSARLEALDDGRLGETIRLRNRDTGRVLSAQISGPNQAIGQ